MPRTDAHDDLQPRKPVEHAAEDQPQAVDPVSMCQPTPAMDNLAETRGAKPL